MHSKFLSTADSSQWNAKYFSYLVALIKFHARAFGYFNFKNFPGLEGPCCGESRAFVSLQHCFQSLQCSCKIRCKCISSTYIVTQFSQNMICSWVQHLLHSEIDFYPSTSHKKLKANTCTLVMTCAKKNAGLVTEVKWLMPRFPSSSNENVAVVLCSHFYVL